MALLTWQQFKEHLSPHLPIHPRYRYVTDGVSRPLFRGHRDSRWKLATTLERSGTGETSFASYHSHCVSVRRFMGNLSPCAIPFEPNPSTAMRDLWNGIPNYEFLAFLRHHGFPSPLLDWSGSPYVAAFFAFRHKAPEGADAVRIFQYRAFTGAGRGGWSREAQLHELGPFATVHERHATQQCSYTVSLKAGEDGNAVICSHEAALANARSTSGYQDEISTYDIAASERERALADLFSMNITPHTLFGSLDALVETAAFRVLGDAG